MTVYSPPGVNCTPLECIFTNAIPAELVCATASCEIFEDSCTRDPISLTARSSWLVASPTLAA